MNRIDAKFKELKKKGDKALVTFITAGDPDLKTTERLVLEMEKAGADLIELGVPFSDPMADGPVIQRSSERALRKNTHISSVLALVKNLRKNTGIPIILFGYFNPILQYGCERFCREAAKAGVDGLIVVDLPPEESVELHRPARKAGLHFIYLLTPTSDEERIQKVRKLASGFLYYVSMTGITGAKLGALNEIQDHIAQIQRIVDLPLCVGFGIRGPDQARNLSRIADGVVVGSRLVSLLDQKGGRRGIPTVARFVSRLKKAVHSQEP
jgi:tryptophan synthase alpha chain